MNTSTTSPLADDASSIADIPRIFTAIFIPLQILCVCVRIFSRWTIKHVWGWEDILILVSLFLQMTLAAITLVAINDGGLGHHQLYILAHNPEELLTWLKVLYAMALIYALGINIPKLAILILYYRVFVTRTARICVCALFGIMVLSTTVISITAIVACKPISSNWSLTAPASDCINKEALYTWSTVPNFVTDVCMLILPLPIVWKLHTSLRTKIGLTLTFAVGSAGLVTSLWKFAAFLTTQSSDLNWSGSTLVIWTQLEPGCYLISACMLTWHPLVDRFFASRWFQSLTSSTSRFTERLHRSGRPTSVAAAADNDSAIKLRPVDTNIIYKPTIKSEGFVRLDEDSTQGENIFITKDFVRNEEDLEMGPKQEQN